MIEMLLALALLQTPPNPTLIAVVQPNTAFRVGWEAQPTDANFRWWCNGEIRKNFASADLVKGPASTTNPLYINYEATVPGLAAGVYECQVGAWNDFSVAAGLAEAKSAPLRLGVGSGPGTPIGLKIIVVVTAGVK